MDDIKILEERWLQYRKSKRKPYYIAVLLIIVVIGLLYLIDISSSNFSFFNDTNTSTIVKKNTLGKIVLEKRKPFLSNEAILTIQHVKPGKQFEPFIPTIDEIVISPKVQEIQRIEEKHAIKRVSKESRKKQHRVIQAKRKDFKITKVSSKSAYQEVERRFNQFHDLDDALFLARVYYSHGAYKKAEKWALNTNKLDNNLEESWIIFVKSKIKLGHINEAKHILLRYIKQSNSQKAKILLYKISK